MESYNDNQNSDSESSYSNESSSSESSYSNESSSSESSYSNESSSSKSYNTSDIQNEDSMPTYDTQEVADYTNDILKLIDKSPSENAKKFQKYLKQIKDSNKDDFTSHIKNLITKRIVNKTDLGDYDIIFSIKKLSTGLTEEDLSEEEYQNHILEYLYEYFRKVVNINPENNRNDNEEERKGGNLPLNTTQVNHPVSQLPENPISSTLQITQAFQPNTNQDVPQDRLAGLKREKEESQSSDDDLNSKKDANKRVKKNNDNDKNI
jgi:hypothetical protein